MPEKECPTKTVGPSWRASTRWAEATASGSVVRGFCTAVALSPAACNRVITSDQHDPSAKSPCTRTTLRDLVGLAAAAIPRADVNEAAVPAMRAAEKVRLLISMRRVPYENSSLSYCSSFLSKRRLGFSSAADGTTLQRAAATSGTRTCGNSGVGYQACTCSTPNRGR